MQPASVLSPADRVCRASMRLGLLVAIVVFFVVGSDVLLSRWIIGNASAEFFLGTAALITGICVGLFGIIGAIGLAIAAVLRTKDDDPAPLRENAGEELG
jgi:hypothetical protein